VSVDFAANARSLGARAIAAADAASLRRALAAARSARETTVVVVPVDREARVGGYESWWDVPVAETSALESVREARQEYDRARRKQRPYL